MILTGNNEIVPFLRIIIGIIGGLKLKVVSKCVSKLKKGANNLKE